jgi:hypothetical protein
VVYTGRLGLGRWDSVFEAVPLAVAGLERRTTWRRSFDSHPKRHMGQLHFHWQLLSKRFLLRAAAVNVSTAVVARCYNDLSLVLDEHLTRYSYHAGPNVSTVI